MLKEFLKIERERKIVEASLCAPALKAKLLAELDAALAVLSAPDGQVAGVQPAKAPSGGAVQGSR